MKKLITMTKHAAITLAACLLFAPATQAQIKKTLAFPGAEGFGAYATGGRGGEVYFVTNLEDSGPGSFRDAVSQPGRTVIFKVGGVIRLKGRIKAESDITIAGQTAPGDGITVYGHGISFSSNTIVRYMRFHGSMEMGRGTCTVVIDNLDDAIFDHVSITWGRWDNVHIKGTSNVTMQHCLIGEGIDPQMFGALFERPQNITVHHCLWVDNQSRNPKGKAGIQYFNNIVYNWKVSGFVGGHSAADHYQDIVNNYFIGGPNSSKNFIAMFTETDHVYHRGNYVDLNKNGALDGRAVTDEDFISATATLMENPTHTAPVPVTLEDAATAYERVIQEAGASLRRDAVDRRLITQLKSLGTEGAIITSQEQVGGQPEMLGGTAQKDTDGDGIPDKWEKAHRLNRKNPSDAKLFTLNAGYTNLETYLNDIAWFYKNSR